MKKILLYISCFSLIIVTSCSKDFLEVVPLGSQVATTVADYEKVLNNPNWYLTTEAGFNELVLLGDELAAEGPYFNNVSKFNTRLFQWQDSVYLIGDPTPYFIDRCLTTFYTLNLVI